MLCFQTALLTESCYYLCLYENSVVKKGYWLISSPCHIIVRWRKRKATVRLSYLISQMQVQWKFLRPGNSNRLRTLPWGEGLLAIFPWWNSIGWGSYFPVFNVPCGVFCAWAKQDKSSMTLFQKIFFWTVLLLLWNLHNSRSQKNHESVLGDPNNPEYQYLCPSWNPDPKNTGFF